MTYFNIRPLVPFIDFACMGDSEELFMHVNAVLIQSVQEGWKREELLKRLARIDGIFVPQFSEKATPQIIEDLNTFETVSRIISPHTEFKNMFLIEIVRGCFHQCNFCIAGHAYGPPRVRDVTHVIASCEKGLRMTNRLGFIASAPSDYPDIDALCHFLDKKGARISFSSLRASSITKSVLSLLAKSHQTSLTLAPETGSERLRYFINKKIPNEKFFHVIESAKEVGMKKIKLYMMFGLPRENDDDLKETVSFIKHVSRILPVRISMTPFIPKPHTPFAVYKIENKNIIRKKISFFRNALGRNKRVMIVFDGIKSAHRQSVFAQGNETVLLDEVEGLPATV